MAITIKRDTGLIGSGLAMTVKVNGEKTTKIPYNQQIELEIPDNEAIVSVSQQGIKSNEVEVKDGQQLEITAKNWLKISMILFMIALPIIIMTLDSLYRVIALLILLILVPGSYFVIDVFRLNIVEKRSL